MNELIFQLDQSRSAAERLALLARLEETLSQTPAGRISRHLKSLLYHPDWYIRQEIAFMIDRYGIPLKAAERRQYWFALQHFEALKKELETDPSVRALLFSGCKDPAPRFRARLLTHLHFRDCRTTEERLLWWYAAGNYTALVEQGCEPQNRAAVLELLQFGLRAENNPLYHRKQCAFALEQLQGLENAAAAVKEMLTEPEESDFRELPADPETVAELRLSPLEKLIRQLQRQGIRVDGKQVFPQIRQAPATGRITYQNPGLQTWPKADRLRRLQPQPGEVWLRFDYCSMEPTLLLHFLLERFLISLEDLPDGDLYAAVNATDRRAAKIWFNAIINGGGRAYHQQLNPWQMLLLDALRELRQELLQTVFTEGGITTIAGNFRKLARTEKNLAGKAVNRLVQGSASDIFNQAVLLLHQQFQREKLPARVGFLLFDEVWVAVAESHASALKPRICQTLLTVNDHFQLLCPLAVRST